MISDAKVSAENKYKITIIILTVVKTGNLVVNVENRDFSMFYMYLSGLATPSLKPGHSWMNQDIWSPYLRSRARSHRQGFIGPVSNLVDHLNVFFIFYI